MKKNKIVVFIAITLLLATLLVACKGAESNGQRKTFDIQEIAHKTVRGERESVIGTQYIFEFVLPDNVEEMGASYYYKCDTSTFTQKEKDAIKSFGPMESNVARFYINGVLRDSAQKMAFKGDKIRVVCDFPYLPGRTLEGWLGVSLVYYGLWPLYNEKDEFQGGLSKKTFKIIVD